MIIIVIKVIFMNLLIAIMNTTMQEVHDKKLLYWKFVRAGILLMMMILDDDNLEEGQRSGPHLSVRVLRFRVRDFGL